MLAYELHVSMDLPATSIKINLSLLIDASRRSSRGCGTCGLPLLVAYLSCFRPVDDVWVSRFTYPHYSRVP